MSFELSDHLKEAMEMYLSEFPPLPQELQNRFEFSIKQVAKSYADNGADMADAYPDFQIKVFEWALRRSFNSMKKTS